MEAVVLCVGFMALMLCLRVVVIAVLVLVSYRHFRYH